jgi:hypothetical protein
MRLFLLFALLVCAAAHAHKPSDSYLSLDAGADSTKGQWDIALRDLEYALGLDSDGDGAITWRELRASRSGIEAYAFARLSVKDGKNACPIRGHELLFDEHSDGGYAVLRFSVPCKATEVEYRLFFDLDPTHRGLLRAGASTSVLSPDQPRARLESRPAWRQFADYAREGVWHIWIGFDHVLFLVCLLLPAVAGARAFSPVFWDVFKVVTAFTIAHSITLALAALAVVQLPSRLVESAIALSVVLAALNNVWPLVHGRRWIVAFGFGLVHGFGFASVLADLGLPKDALLVALVGFNAGVEAGQLVIVAAVLPLSFALRNTWAYRRLVLVGGSVAIALVAALWLVERAFDVELGLI